MIVYWPTEKNKTSKDVSSSRLWPMPGVFPSVSNANQKFSSPATGRARAALGDVFPDVFHILVDIFTEGVLSHSWIF